MVVVEHDDLALVVDAPRRAVEQGPKLDRVVVPEHEVEPPAGRPEPLVGKRQPVGQARPHELDEQAVEAPVGPSRLELAGLCPVGVVAVIGDQLLEGLEVRSSVDLVGRPDECAAVPAVSPADDRLERLAGDVAPEDQDVDAIRSAGVDELAEALARSVEIGCEVDLGLRWAIAAQPPAGRERSVWTASISRIARSRSTGFQVIPSTFRLVPTIAPSATPKISSTRSARTPVLAMTGVAGAGVLGLSQVAHLERDARRPDR